MARKRKDKKVCCIADQHCTAPAGWGTGSGYAVNDDPPNTLPACHDCGRDVCRNCSYTRDKTRYCADCFVDKFGEKAAITVLARMYRLAGYDGSRELAKARMRGEDV